MKEFLVRTGSAAGMIALVYLLVSYLSKELFCLFVFLLATLAVYEFSKLVGAASWQMVMQGLGGVMLGSFFLFGVPELSQVIFLYLFLNGIILVFWVCKPERLPLFPAVFGQQFLALLYVYFPLYYLFLLREQNHNLLFFLIYAVAIGDSGAYFFGKAFGKHKIYPIASPKKSLEGFIAAIISSALFSWLGFYLFSLQSMGLGFVIGGGAFLALLSQLADPLESLFKRFAQVKDSGQLIPGHGGILDRIDSYLLCAPAFYYLVKLFT